MCLKMMNVVSKVGENIPYSRNGRYKIAEGKMHLLHLLLENVVLMRLYETVFRSSGSRIRKIAVTPQCSHLQPCDLGWLMEAPVTSASISVTC